MTHAIVPQLISLLAPTLGDQKAAALVSDAARALAIAEHATEHDDGLRILEKIAAVPGIAGVAARFAKSRFHLAALPK